MNMRAGKKALGKGIASLLDSNRIGGDEEPDEIVPERFEGISPDNSREKGIFQLVEIERIFVNKNQPRKEFCKKALDELENSIREVGVLQPLVVRDIGDGNYEIIAGERRFRAAKQARLKVIPIMVKEVTSRDQLVLAVIENIQRAELNCVEEALAYRRLIDEFSISQEDVAKKVGKERSSVANALRILKLPSKIRDFLQAGLLSFGHAKVLLSIKDPRELEALSEKVIEKSLSVRDLEKLVKNHSKVVHPKDSPNSIGLKESCGKLEGKTGFQIKILGTENRGKMVLRFQTKDEFNQIFDFLMR